MKLLKDFAFEFVDSKDRKRSRLVRSKNLNGAVRKLYQEYDVVDIIRIL